MLSKYVTQIKFENNFIQSKSDSYASLNFPNRLSLAVMSIAIILQKPQTPTTSPVTVLSPIQYGTIPTSGRLPTISFCIPLVLSNTRTDLPKQQGTRIICMLVQQEFPLQVVKRFTRKMLCIFPFFAYLTLL